jgi:purine-nucleoside/S-methyl-5'-thioadenosine phosphorylase / adenosine deaminase
MSTPIEMITDDPAIRDAGFYWRERDSVRALVSEPLESAGFTNAFSTRGGGVSPIPEKALNLAGFNEDEAENIYENRRRFLNLLPGQWTIAGCWQTHSADIRVVHSEEEAKPKPGVLGDDEYCDALISNTPNILLAVKTADCVPILLGDPKNHAFAAVHAGWRGTSASIVRRAVEGLQTKYQSRAGDLIAAIGPAANGCCYEVGPEVIKLFKERFPDNDYLFTATAEDHAKVDLQRANRDQLMVAGVRAANIYAAPLCTMERTDLFFSYRREKQRLGRVGRLMSVIGRR